MASNAVIGTLRAILTLDTAEFEANTRAASDSMKSWSRDFKTMGAQATQLGAGLTKTLTLPIVALGGGMVKAAMDFESSFAGIRKTVDASEAEFDDMAKALRGLAMQIPIDVNELNRLGEAAGALGIPKQEVVEFAKVMAMLGTTTNLTSEQAANAIARIQNIFGQAGKDTDRLASTLVALGNAGASTETEIVEMAQRIAGAGHTIGLTQAQVLSFASTLASVGINAEAGGSAISRIFLKMNDAVMSGGGALAEFARVAGVSAAQFKQAFEQDAANATVMFVNGLARLKGEGENTNATMEGMIGKNIILKDTLNRLTGSGDLLTKQLALGNTAWQQNTALTEEARKRFETTEAQLTLLWNKIKDVGITIGNAMLPAVRALVSAADTLLPVIQSLAKAFAALPATLQIGAIGLAALAAAAGPVLLVFGQLAFAAASMTAAFTTQGLATRGLAATMTILNADLLTLTAGMRATALATAGNVTAMGAMNVAAVTATGVVRSLWAVLAAHPFVAITAVISGAALALTKYYEARKMGEQKELIDGIKAETIARAEHTGVVLKQVDAHKRYLEAVDVLQKVETIRQAQFTTSLPIKKAAIEAELEFGRITREQANVQLAALGVEEKANTVREKRMTIADATALAEKQYQEEIKASGYSVSELTKAIQDNAAGFEAWAKTSGLSSETISRLKASIKEAKAEIKEAKDETRDAAKAAEEYAKAWDQVRAATKALGITTEQDLIEQINEVRVGLSGAAAAGVALKNMLPPAIARLKDLQKQAKDAGIELNDLNETTEALEAELRKLHGAPPVLPASLFTSGKEGLAALVSGAKLITPEMLKASTSASILKNAYRTLGIKTQAELLAMVNAARQAYIDIAVSGKATADELIAARERVTAAEREAGIETVSIWRDRIAPAISAVLEGVSISISSGLVNMIGHWNRHAEILQDIWQGIKNSFLNVLDQMLASFINGFLQGLLKGIGAAKLGETVASSLQSFGKKMIGGLSSLMTLGIGGMIAAAIPLVIAGVKQLGSLISGLFKGEGAKTNDVRDEWMQAMGGFEGSRTVLAGHGNDAELIRAFEQAYFASNRGDFEAGRAAFDARLAQLDSGIPDLATGGIVMPRPGGTLVRLAEAGMPEAVIPLDGAAAGGTMTFILERDGRAEARFIAPFLPGEVRRLQLAR